MEFICQAEVTQSSHEMHGSSCVFGKAVAFLTGRWYILHSRHSFFFCEGLSVVVIRVGVETDPCLDLEANFSAFCGFDSCNIKQELWDRVELNGALFSVLESISIIGISCRGIPRIYIVQSGEFGKNFRRALLCLLHVVHSHVFRLSKSSEGFVFLPFDKEAIDFQLPLGPE